MVNSPQVLETVPIDTWVEAAWEDFLTFADICHPLVASNVSSEKLTIIPRLGRKNMGNGRADVVSPLASALPDK